MKSIGLDIGTTSICGVVVDTATREILSRHTARNDSRIAAGGEFERLQDPETILQMVESILNRLLSDVQDASSIGISSQMHGIVYTDRSGASVSPLYTWQDMRGDRIFQGSKRYCDVFKELTGYSISTGYGMVTHFYHIVNQALPADAISLCTIGDYVAMRLGGSIKPTTDATLAASLGGFDLRAGTFDTYALRKASITDNMLPIIAPHATEIGKFDGRLTVYNAIGDNQASYFGAVQSVSDSLLVNIGTGAQLSVMTESVTHVPNWETRPAVGGGYLLVGAMPNGGNVYAVVEKFFRDVMYLFGPHHPESLFDEMEDLLECARPGVDGLQVSTQFYGTREHPDSRGAIHNIMPENFTPIDLMIGTVEGLVDQLVSFYERLPDELKRKMKHVVGSGNGIRKSRYMRERIEQRLSKTIEVALCDEEAAYGAALYAGGYSS